jgi:hypothetical protein
MKPQPHFVACLSCGSKGRYTQEKWYALQSWNTRATDKTIEALVNALKVALHDLVTFDGLLASDVEFHDRMDWAAKGKLSEVEFQINNTKSIAKIEAALLLAGGESE